MVRMHSPLYKFQMRMVLSSEAVASMRLPRYLSAVTVPVWPVSVRTSRQLVSDHTLTVRSSEAEAICVSPVNSMAVTPFRWPTKRRTHSNSPPLGFTSHTRMSFWLAHANNSPLLSVSFSFEPKTTSKRTSFVDVDFVDVVFVVDEDPVNS